MANPKQGSSNVLRQFHGVKAEPLHVEEPDIPLLTDNGKKEHYTQLFQGVPDAIFVLSGRARNIGSPEEPEYASTGYDYSDSFGMVAGIARVDAAAEVSHYFPDTKIVTASYTPPSPYGPTPPIIDANVREHPYSPL